MKEIHYKAKRNTKVQYNYNHYDCLIIMYYYTDSHLYSANLYPVIQHENNILAIFCMCQCTSLHMKVIIAMI